MLARRNRRPNRRSDASDDLEHVATQVAYSAVDSENSDGTPVGGKAGTVILKQHEEGTRMMVQLADKVGDVKPRQPLGSLLNLPTPGRNSRNPPPPPPAQAPTPTASMANCLNGLSTLPPPPLAPAVPMTAPPTYSPNVHGPHLSAPPIMSAMLPATPGPIQVSKGPEPWMATRQPEAASSPVATPAAQTKGGYREWLQARGQQAMHRSLGTPASPMAVPPPSPSTPMGSPMVPLATVPPFPVGPVMPQMAAPVVNASSASNRVPLPIASTSPPQAGAWNVQCPEVQQQWYPQAEASPMSAQAPLMIPGLCPRGSMVQDYVGQASSISPQGFPMMDCSPQAMLECGGQSPMVAMMGQQPPYGSSLSYCHQAPFIPAEREQVWEDSMQQMGMQPTFEISPSARETSKGNLSHEEMMAALMPLNQYGPGLNKEQLAQQLKAAAPCVYDD
jgi:hypothetical protein